jgi:hypothetical protein
MFSQTVYDVVSITYRKFSIVIGCIYPSHAHEYVDLSAYAYVCLMIE